MIHYSVTKLNRSTTLLGMSVGNSGRASTPARSNRHVDTEFQAHCRAEIGTGRGISVTNAMFDSVLSNQLRMLNIREH